MFGKTMTPTERLRQHQHALTKAQQELDREKKKLAGSEGRLIADIKKNAKEGNMNACKILAKDLVRNRRYVQRFSQMHTQLQAVSLRIQTIKSNQQMGEAMRGASRAMAAMNRQTNLPAMQKIMNDFEREDAMMDMKQEMMSDAVDEVMDDAVEDEESEGDEILKKVLDEIGVDLSQQLFETPTNLATQEVAKQREAVAIGESGPRQAGPQQSTSDAVSDEDSLQARLDALRRG